MIPKFFSAPALIKMKSLHLFRDTQEVRFLFTTTSRNFDRNGNVLVAWSEAAELIIKVSGSVGHQGAMHT